MQKEEEDEFGEDWWEEGGLDEGIERIELN